MSWSSVLSIIFIAYALPLIFLNMGWIGAFSATVLMAIIALTLVGLICIFCQGLTSLEFFEECLDELLRQGLQRKADQENDTFVLPDTRITFADLEAAGCRPLRIVAANISKRDLQLFSDRKTPGVGVASAVAASICLPIVFKPWKIEDELFLDGGLVSNLPAWTFDSERAREQDAWTAVFQVAKKRPSRNLWGPNVIKAAIVTGIFGSGVLNLRNIDRLRTVSLGTKLKLLQFDPGLPYANQVVNDARIECERQLIFQIDGLPQQMERICERIKHEVESRLTRTYDAIGAKITVGKLRVAIYVPAPDDPSMMIAEHHVGFEHAVDERARWPIDRSFVGEAFTAGAPLFFESIDQYLERYYSQPTDRWLRKRMEPGLAWIICVPSPQGASAAKMVVTVDSTAHLGLVDDLKTVFEQSVASSIEQILREFLPKEVIYG